MLFLSPLPLDLDEGGRSDYANVTPTTESPSHILRSVSRRALDLFSIFGKASEFGVAVLSVFISFAVDVGESRPCLTHSYGGREKWMEPEWQEIMPSLPCPPPLRLADWRARGETEAVSTCSCTVWRKESSPDPRLVRRKFIPPPSVWRSLEPEKGSVPLCPSPNRR